MGYWLLENWLLSRLTPAKGKEARWTELAIALEKTWAWAFDPEFFRLERLRSSYQADDQDLLALMRQMGDYFSFDLPRREDRPIAVAWRRLELEYKDMELLLQSVFRRHYGELPVTWFPLFAPLNEPYGSCFIAAEGPWPEKKNVPPAGMFLTSRGLLGVEHGYLLKMGLNKKKFLDRVMPIVRKAKPLHIVYDGTLWYIRFDIPFEADFTSNLLWERDWGPIELQFTVLGSRFDYTPVDANYLDIQSALCTWERENICPLSFVPEYSRTWRLDKYLKESILANWLPLDVVVIGNETDKNIFVLVSVTSSQRYELFSKPFQVDIVNEIIDKNQWAFLQIDIEFNNSNHNLYRIPFISNKWRLDSYLPEHFICDWLPTDTILIGYENDKNPFVLVAHGVKQKFNIYTEKAQLTCYWDRKHKYDLHYPPFVIHNLNNTIDRQFKLLWDNSQWQLDRGVANVPDGWLEFPVIPGSEDNVSGAVCFTDKQAKFSLAMDKSDVFVIREKPNMALAHFYPDMQLFGGETANVFPIKADFSNSGWLDHYPRFDTFPADQFPLDMPIGGVYA